MSTSQPATQRRGGLANVVDIIIAPNAAFDRIREVPTWLWAFIIATVLGAAGSLLAQPAILHALETSMPAQLAADPNMARLSPDQQQKQIALVMGAIRVFARAGWILTPFYILVVGLIQALALLVANAIGKGQGTFSRFFALSVTVSVIGTGFYYLIMGTIVVIRGADSFDSTTAVQSVVPSLALLVPGSHGALPAFLGVLNVFYLWAVALLALGAVRIGRMAPALAWATPIVLLLCWALFTAYGARNGG